MTVPVPPGCEGGNVIVFGSDPAGPLKYPVRVVYVAADGPAPLESIY